MNKDIKTNSTFNTKKFTISIECLDINNSSVNLEMSIVTIKNINTQCKICEIIIYEDASTLEQANGIFKIYDIDINLMIVKKCKHEELYLYKGDYKCKDCGEII